VKTILPFHAVRVQLNLNGLPDHWVHESRLGEEDGGVLELNAMAQVNAVFGHG
jgi:hypothetical protein